MFPHVRSQFRRPLILSAIPLGLLVALMLLMGAVRLEASSSAIGNAVFPAQQDAYVSSASPDSNLGAGPIGVVPTSRGYVQFDLSALPPDATILEARLRLKPSSFAGAPPSTVGLGRIDEAWNEGTVTWNTRPDATAGGPSAVVADLNWVSWDVKPLVEGWHADPTTNFGFVLGTQNVGVFFHSKEDGPAPELFVRFEVEEPNRPRTDLGDAPDSTNHLGIPSPAYGAPAPVAGQFPTVWEGPQPSGPKHINQTGEMILGNYISAEAEADQGADQDGPNNLQQNGGLLIPDRDRADDGWLNRNVSFPDCRRTTLTVRVSKAATTTLETAYLNVFFDGNRDGDWADVGGCQNPETGQQARSYEWIVQNFAVDMTAIPAGGYRDINVTTLLVHNPAPDRPHWVRFTLSEAEAVEDPAINRADGRGPAHPNAFAYGETEDYFYAPQPQGQPGELLIRKRVISETSPVGYAGTVTYQINVKHEGGTAPIAAEIRDLLQYPQHLIGSVEVTEVMTGVTPLFAQVEYKRDPQSLVNTLIRWQGMLAPNAEIQISFPVHIHPLCQPNQQTVEIVNIAQVRRLNGDTLDDSVSFQALCPGVSLSDISVSQIVPEDNSDLDASAAAMSLGNFEIQDFRKIPVQTTFTNNGQSALTLGYRLEIAQVETAIPADAASPMRRNGVLTLEAGESATVETIVETAALFGSAIANIPADPAVDLEFESKVRFAILPLDLAQIPLETLDPGQIGNHVDKFKVRPWDVGDAPDSSNHFGAAMTAYPATPATFPTVFDASTGLPEGPAHARPRPFHLGAAVDLERDADLPPAPRNIVPPANIADQDNFDDGANPNSWALTHCRPTTVPVRVFISPAAVAWITANNDGIGYLNSWIDSNRDGSWDDFAQCPNPETGATEYAPEHIIIDAPINVAALGAGLHTITVNTGRVPWPAAQADDPAWVRLTLSERVSNKTFTTPDGKSYGDGRGYAVPFRTGETEDYLRKPQQSGADMAMNVDLRWQPVPKQDANAAATSLNFEKIKVTFRANFANLGNEDAQNVKFLATIPNEVVLEDIVVTKFGESFNPENITRDGNQVTVNLGSVPANSRGAVLIQGTIPTSALVNNEVIEGFLAQVTSDNDVNPDNNQESAALTVELPTPRVGVKASWSPFLVPGGTTCSTTVEMAGTGVPDSELVVALIPLHDHDHADIHASAVVTHWQGPLTATVKIGPGGRWGTTWDNLGSGGYSGGIVGRGGLEGFGRSASLDKSSPKLQAVRFNVNTDLRIDPMSLAFQAENGRLFHPNTLGWGREQWQVRLPDGVYTVGINVCQKNANTQISLEIAGVGTVELTDENSDGRYEGQVTIGGTAARSAAATQDLTLTVVSDGQESIYGGSVESVAPGQVKDAATNVALSGAVVTLYAEADDQAVYSAWNGDDYGQINPQTTAADGSYLFTAPAGSYFVTAVKEGYQPFRSNEIAVDDVVNEAISLTPVVAGEPDVVIAITEGGFSPANVTVKPGSVVKFVNTDMIGHNVSGPANWNSGILFSRESYTVKVGESGVIAVTDSTSPTYSGQIVIDPLAGQSQIYLPTVTR
jgi:plastocyanin